MERGFTKAAKPYTDGQAADARAEFWQHSLRSAKKIASAAAVLCRIAIIVHSKEEDGLRPDPSNVPHFNVDLYKLPILETVDMANNCENMEMSW